MPNKRNIENLLGSASPPGKRCHVATTDVENEKVFLVFSGGNVIGICFDKNETEQYANDEQTRVVAFKNFEDAAQYAKEAKDEETQMRNARRESVSLSAHDVFAENTADTNDFNATVCVTEPVNSEQRDWIDRREASVSERTELHMAQVTEPSDHVTVFASSTIAKAKGKISRMSYGVYFGEDSPYNVSDAVVGRASTQRAELIAALKAVKATIRGNLVTSDGHIELCISSSYVPNGIGSWMPKWKKSGWKNANRGPLRNTDLWQELDALLEEIGRDRVTFTTASARESMQLFAAGRLAEKALRISQ